MYDCVNSSGRERTVKEKIQEFDLACCSLQFVALGVDVKLVHSDLISPCIASHSTEPNRTDLTRSFMTRYQCEAREMCESEREISMSGVGFARTYVLGLSIVYA